VKLETGTITFNKTISTTILCVGGGGGGGYSSYPGFGIEGAGGGGGGSVGVGSLTFNQNEQYTITIGSGGSGGVYTGTIATKGGNTIISGSNINVIVYGGGFGGSAIGGAGQGGGTGGSGSTGSSVGGTGNPGGTGGGASGFDGTGGILIVIAEGTFVTDGLSANIVACGINSVASGDQASGASGGGIIALIQSSTSGTFPETKVYGGVGAEVFGFNTGGMGGTGSTYNYGINS
jgi:hypothetical protein